MEELLKLKKVSKKYGDKTVLNNIDLSLIKGQTLAITGPNGTGKSTLLRIIANLTAVTEGERVITNKKKLVIGYVPEHFPKLNFTPEEYLIHMGSIQGLTQKYIKETINILFNVFNICSMKDTLIKHLSKGTIQKVAVMQALLSEPDILLLDEPLSGQDISSQENFIDLLKEYKKKEISIVIACHEAFLVEQLADRVIRIESGRIVGDMKNKVIMNDCMSINVRVPNQFDMSILNQHNGLMKIIQSGHSLKLVVEKKQSDNFILMLLEMKCSILSVNEFRE